MGDIQKTIKICSLTLMATTIICITGSAWALPAFAIRENVSCTVCHSNGSAPHLTEAGFLYRRAGFRFPANIGKADIDAANLDLLKHFVFGVNVDYDYVNNATPGVNSQTVTSNNFDLREAEIYPLVGAFLGNFATWSEIDYSPTTSTNAGSVDLSFADIRYVWGDQDHFYTVRAGLMAPEGYGASDQFIDDGADPIMDTLSAIHAPGDPVNQLDTMTQPFGANNVPEIGAEFGVSWPHKYLTVGMYNGYDGSNGGVGGGATAPSLVPAQMNQQRKDAKDFKVQYDQFYSNVAALTAAYYYGNIALKDPSSTNLWNNIYQAGRLYGTWFLAPNVLDLMVGVGDGQYEFTNAGGSSSAGHFNSTGAFVGANYYVKPHLTLSAHVDYFNYDSTTSGNPTVNAVYLLASLPYENNIWVFHLIHTDDYLNGHTNDFRAEWRFLY